MHLVELCGTDQYFAMKAMDKGVMLNRNKVLKNLSFNASFDKQSIYNFGYEFLLLCLRKNSVLFCCTGA